MGRPINSRKIGALPGAVSATVFVDAVETAEAGTILRQRSNTRYLVEGDTSTVTMVCKLVDGAPAALGEMSIAVIADDDHGTLATSAIGAAGTTYTMADSVTLSNGATITIDTVGGGGEVLTYTVVTAGGLVSVGQVLTATGGTGTNLTITVSTVSAFTEYARILNNRGVKTFQGNVYAWPEDVTVTARITADVQEQA